MVGGRGGQGKQKMTKYMMENGEIMGNRVDWRE